MRVGVRVGVQDGFEDFVRARGPALLRYAHLVCGDAGQAEDLVQDALVKLHRRWDDGLAIPLAYARRIITNDYLSWRRRLMSTERIGTVPDHATPSRGDELVERDAVWRVIAELARRQRVVLVLRYYEDLPDREIAEVIGLAEGSVRSLAARAFATLRSRPELARFPTDHSSERTSS